MLTLIRVLVALAMATLTLVPANGAAGAHPAGEPIPVVGSVWNAPQPLGIKGPKDYFAQTIGKPTKRLELVMGTTNAYYLRRLEWKGWGTGRVVITGQARFCYQTCSPWKPAKIVLTAPKPVACGDVAFSFYGKYALRKGFGVHQINRTRPYRAHRLC